MSQQRKKNLAYYIRLDQRTFQGKLTVYFLMVAFLMLLTLIAFSRIVYSYHADKEYQTQTLLPSIQQLEQLSYLMEVSANPSAGKDNDKVNQILTKLNNLANKWEEEHFVFLYQQLLDKVESVQQLAETDQAWKESPDLQHLQRNLSRLQLSLQQSSDAIQAKHQDLQGTLNTYIFIIYLLLFAAGVYIAHLVIRNMVTKIKVLRYTIRDIAKGYLPDSFDKAPDEFNSTRQELSLLSTNLKSLTGFAREVGQGNFDASLEAFEQESTLGKSLSEMRDSLKKVAEEEVSRRWFNEGIAQFSDIIRRNNQDIDSLTHAIISPLVKHLQAVQGALFVLEEDEKDAESYLKMRACYAYDRVKHLQKRIPAGNGLIGQAFLEKEQIYLTEIPENYESITTGLGTGSPKSLILMPLRDNDKIEGVLEIASMHKMGPHQIEFLEKISETIATAIGSVKTTEKTQRLLEDTQLTAEQMRAQEEEMRQNMEEMQATQEEMLRAQKELANKEANLNAFINNTSDSIITVTRGYKVGLINDVLKKRYKGTAYEGIKEGSDVLPTLGKVADEWKAYYDRAFAGERLDFTLKSSVQGEDSWREYFIHPIRDQHGEVNTISVISRDISEKMRFELGMKKKEALLRKIVNQPSAAYIGLDENFRVLVFSQQAMQYFPEINEQLSEGQVLPESIIASSRQVWIEKLQEAAKGNKVIFTRENEPNRQISLNPLFDKEDALLAILISSKELK